MNAFIDRYRLARTLYDANGIASLLERELGILGLLDDLPFLMRLEAIYLTAKNKNQQSEGKSQIRWKH